MTDYVPIPLPPPDDSGTWVQFGCHADPEFCDYDGKLEFGPDNTTTDYLPDWERHADGSLCTGVLS